MMPPKKTPHMTRAHYEHLAWWCSTELLSLCPDGITWGKIVESLATDLKGTNPTFNKEKFILMATGKTCA